MATEPHPISPHPITQVEDVIVDTTDGPSVEITKDGPRATRTSTVKGLRGNGAARLWWAINAPRVPRYGDEHPVIRGLPVSRVYAALASERTTDIAIVTCEYYHPTGGNLHFANIAEVRDSSLPQLEITSTVQAATTQFYLDAQGGKHQILLPYTRTNEETQTSEVLPLQAGTVEYQLPMTVFRYMRRERTPVDVIRDKSREFVGTIDAVSAIHGTPIFGEGATNFWMCTRLDGVSDDAGRTSNVAYEFQRHPETWNPVLIYVDPLTQLPVIDPDVDSLGVAVNATANGIGRFRIYQEKDFERLELTI